MPQFPPPVVDDKPTKAPPPHVKVHGWPPTPVPKDGPTRKKAPPPGLTYEASKAPPPVLKEPAPVLQQGGSVAPVPEASRVKPPPFGISAKPFGTTNIPPPPPKPVHPPQVPVVGAASAQLTRSASRSVQPAPTPQAVQAQAELDRKAAVKAKSILHCGLGPRAVPPPPRWPSAVVAGASTPAAAIRPRDMPVLPVVTPPGQSVNSAAVHSTIAAQAQAAIGLTIQSGGLQGTIQVAAQVAQAGGLRSSPQQPQPVPVQQAPLQGTTTSPGFAPIVGEMVAQSQWGTLPDGPWVAQPGAQMTSVRSGNASVGWSQEEWRNRPPSASHWSTSASSSQLPLAPMPARVPPSVVAQPGHPPVPGCMGGPVRGAGQLVPPRFNPQAQPSTASLPQAAPSTPALQAQPAQIPRPQASSSAATQVGDSDHDPWAESLAEAKAKATAMLGPPRGPVAGAAIAKGQYDPSTEPARVPLAGSGSRWPKPSRSSP